MSDTEAADRTVENPELNAAFRQKDRQRVEDSTGFSSTADRIIGILQDEPIKVNLTEDVSLSFRCPSDDEYLEIVAFQTESVNIARKTQDLKIDVKNEDESIRRIPEAMQVVESARAMLDHLNRILSNLCLNPEFTPEVFAKMPRRYKTLIFEVITQSRMEEIEKVKKFREE